MNIKNDIVDMLTELSRYERGFKQQAFINAAAAIDTLSIDSFNDCCTKGSFKGIHGIGNSANELILEALRTGKMIRLEQHRQTNLNKKVYDFT